MKVSRRAFLRRSLATTAAAAVTLTAAPVPSAPAPVQSAPQQKTPPPLEVTYPPKVNPTLSADDVFNLYHAHIISAADAVGLLVGRDEWVRFCALESDAALRRLGSDPQRPGAFGVWAAQYALPQVAWDCTASRGLDVSSYYYVQPGADRD